MQDRTFFFVDYQGQRQSIGRTVISTVPTAAAAPGHLHRSDRRSRAGHLRSGDHGRLDAHAVSGQHDSGGPHGPGGARRCCSATRCRPRPARPTTTAGPRTRSTIRISGTSRIDHKFSSNRDQVFGRLLVLPRRLRAGDAAPRGQRRDGGHARARRTRRRGRSRRTTSTRSRSNILNELRIGDTRRTVGADGGAARDVGRRGAQHSRHSVDGAVSQHAADVSDRRLPAARLAAEHRVGLQHQRVGSRRLADVAEGAAHAQDGIRLALGAARTSIQPPSPTGSFTFNAIGSDLPGTRQHRHAARELPARPGADLLDRSAADARSRSARTSRSNFIQDDWKVSDRLTHQSRPALHAEFPVDRDQRPDGASSTCRRSSSNIRATEPVRPLKKNNFGPRLGAVYRLTDKTIVSVGLRPGLDRDGRASRRRSRRRRFRSCRRSRSARSTRSTRRSCCRTGRASRRSRRRRTAGLGQGVFAVDGTLGSGLRRSSGTPRCSAS